MDGDGSDGAYGQIDGGTTSLEPHSADAGNDWPELTAAAPGPHAVRPAASTASWPALQAAAPGGGSNGRDDGALSAGSVALQPVGAADRPDLRADGVEAGLAPALADRASRRVRIALEPRRRTVLGGVALLTAAALVGVTVAVVNVGPAASPSSAMALNSQAPSAPLTGSQPPASPGTSPAATAPTQPSGEWAAADLPPFDPIAELVATREEPNGTSVRTAFQLTTHSASAAAADLAKALEVTPPIQLAVAPGSAPGTARLTPAAPLAPRTTYRAVLRLPDGSLAGSWVFRTGSAPRIAGTLPADQTTEVPLSTGIEITWDQDGVGNMASFFSISPNVAGRFERHGRTAVFVPTRDLKPLTVYTVTIRRGVPLTGSDLVLEEPVTFRFETDKKPGAASTNEPLLAFAGSLVETAVGQVPVMEMDADGVSKVGVGVYRLASLSAAVDAYLALQAAPDWADRSDFGLVSTGGLARVASFTAALHRWPSSGDGWIRFPDPLPPGWYLVTVPRKGRDLQAVLQVTNVQAALLAGSGRTIVWVHDLATKGPLTEATVATLDGTTLGRTGADGLLVAGTPTAVLGADLEKNPRAGFVVIRAAGSADGAPPPAGRSIFVPVAAWSAGVPLQDSFWQLLYTDRSLFRQTDTIDAWGMLRPRDGTATPAAELRLTAGPCWDWEPCTEAAIVSKRVAPNPNTGVFAASLPFAGLPTGDYDLGLYVGNQRIAGAWIQVGIIRKPAYRLDVATDRHVYVAGDKLKATVTASFFDGTRAPGVLVTVEGTHSESGDRPTRRATTGADGTGTVTLPVKRPGEQWQWADATATVASAAEADISGSAPVVVISSGVVLDGTATVKGTTLAVRGSLHAVDLARLERELAAGVDFVLDPNGAAVPRRIVTAVVEDHWTVRVPKGRVYDFIAKQAVDVYDYEDRSKTLGTWRATTATDGSFSLAIPVRAAGHWFDVTLSAADSRGRKTSLRLHDDAPDDALHTSAEATGAGPTLALAGAHETENGPAYAVGDVIRATALGANGSPMPAGGDRRYLFFTARTGSLTADVQEAPVFTTTFDEASIPSLSIGAAWFDGTAGGIIGLEQEPDGCGGSMPTVQADFDRSTRLMKVSLTANATRYQPGETATVDVRTTDAAGRPVAADVVLRAIDEKLYAIGGALTGDVLWDLYAPGWGWLRWSDGIVTMVSTHRLPAYRESMCSTAGGGGETPRQDFRDTLLFRRVTTDANGRATVSFDLSDDLTSWRISATAISAHQEVGQATLHVPVGLPLFVEVPLAPDYLAGDRPVLRVRAYGTALKAGDAVTFTVDAPTLGMAATTILGKAFTSVDVPLPALRTGDHAVTIGASAGSGAAASADRLVRTIHVVDTRFTQRKTAYGDLAGGLPAGVGGTGLINVVLSDAGRARYAATLESLAGDDGARLDQALSAAIARDLLVSEFGADPARFEAAPFDPSRYMAQVASGADETAVISGLALLTYASPDVALAARAALVAGDRLDRVALREYFDWIRAAKDDPQFEGFPPAKSTRESRNMALAGLAGLGEPVLAEVRAALKVTTLSIRERLYLALGAATLGDHPVALRVERDLLGQLGQRLGPWLRMRVGDSLDDTIEATALVALIAAIVGDPVAEPAEAYVEANRSWDNLYNLQEAGYVARVLERIPAATARVAYTIDGSERTVDIPAANAVSITMTPAQWATFRARPIGGRVGIAVAWDAAVDPATLVRDPSLTLRRTISGGSPIRSDRPVSVTLSATFGPQAVGGVYCVVDTLPSGLAPYEGTSQSVSVCMDRKNMGTYQARVVTPGTYVWEPAIMQLEGASESLALVPATTVEIR